MEKIVDGIYLSDSKDYILKMSMMITFDNYGVIETHQIADILYNLTQKRTLRHMQHPNRFDEYFYHKEDIPFEIMQARVNEVIIPRRRVNIDEVLKDYGLSSYDPLKMFLLTNGGGTNSNVWYRFEEETYDEVKEGYMMNKYKPTLDKALPNGLI